MPVELVQSCIKTRREPLAVAVFGFKKGYRDLYLPADEPALVDVPEMAFAAVAGTGDPNEEDGVYAQALALLCASPTL